MNFKLLRWLPACVWAATIFWLSSLSSPPMPEAQFPLKDKIGHALIYAGLTWLIAWALRAPSRSLPKTLALAILMASAYGASDEWHQRYVPRRSCDVMDWLADTIGACAAAAAFYAYESHRSSKTNRPTA